MKGNALLAIAAGLGFVPIVIIIALLGITVLGLALGFSWILKNMVAISAFFTILAGLYLFVKQRRVSFSGFAVLAGILLIVAFAGQYAGLFALGLQNEKYDVKINTGGSFDLLAAGVGDSEGLSESTFSVTCKTPLEGVTGCRIGPGTYRPLSVDICNKDPELPLPPHVVLVSVNPDVNFKRNDQVNFDELEIPREADTRSDVYIASGDPKAANSWKEKIRKFLTSSIKYTTMKDEMIVVGATIPTGQCYSDVYGHEIGVDENGNANLFVVAGPGAEINTQPVVSVALVEMKSTDPVFDKINNFVSDYGWITPIATTVLGGAATGLFLGPVGAIVGGAIGWVVGGGVNQVITQVTQVLQLNVVRTVFATGAYKFWIAYPNVEIVMVLGVIAVLAIAAGRFVFKWW